MPTTWRKYGNKKTNGYDSKRESKRAQELKLMQLGGLISDLEEQVRFEVIPKQVGERAAHYIADFRYVENGAVVVEDSKGFKTLDYVLKRKLMLFIHGIRVKES